MPGLINVPLSVQTKIAFEHVQIVLCNIFTLNFFLFGVSTSSYKKLKLLERHTHKCNLNRTHKKLHI